MTTKFNIALSHSELVEVLSALSACNSVGGGSATNSLLMRLQGETGQLPSEYTINHMCERVLEGAIECGMVKAA